MTDLGEKALLPVTGYQVSGSKFRVLSSEFQVPGFKFQVSSSGFQVSSFKFRVRVRSSKLKVQGFGSGPVLGC